MDPIILRVRRAALGLRQRDVAERAGISQSRYSLIERGELLPTGEDREFIEKVLPPLPAEVRKELLLAPSE